jgi:hypothetical protein
MDFEFRSAIHSQGGQRVKTTALDRRPHHLQPDLCRSSCERLRPGIVAVGKEDGAVLARFIQVKPCQRQLPVMDRAE